MSLAAAVPATTARASAAMRSERLIRFMVVSVEGSERDLHAREEDLLVGAVGTGGGAAVEICVRVVEGQLEVGVEVPVDAQAPGARVRGGGGGIGEQRERVVVDVEPADARDQL